MSDHATQQVPTGVQSKTRWRVVTSAVAVFMGALIYLEPFLIDTKPGLQNFQAVLLAWFWALFMFGYGGTPARESSRQ